MNTFFFFFKFLWGSTKWLGSFFFFLFLKRVGVTLEQAVMDHNYGVVILNKVNGSDPQTIGSQVTPSKSTVELFRDQGCRQYCCNHHYHFLSVTVLLLMWRTNWWICYASVADLTVSGAEQPSLPRLCFRSLKFSKYALCTYWVSGTVPGTGDGWTGRGPHHQGAHGISSSLAIIWATTLWQLL